MITSPEGKIWIALTTRLQAWTGTEDMVVSDQVYTPDVSRPFIYVQPVWLSFEAGAIPFDCGSEYRGFLNMAVRVPVGSWNAASHLGLANRAMALFEYGATYEYQDAAVQIFDRPRLTASIYLDGAHNRVDAQIPFRCWG